MKSETETNNTPGIRTDLFAAIKYESRKCKSGTVIGLELGGHFVFRWIFQEAWKHISAGIMTADRCKFHTAKSLFNDADAWAKFGANAIGRCLRYFVDHRMLPLSVVNPNETGSKLYALTNR